jgi:hypothetical protein
MAELPAVQPADEYRAALDVAYCDPQRYRSQEHQELLLRLAAGGASGSATPSLQRRYREALALADTDPRAYHSPAHQARLMELAASMQSSAAAEATPAAEKATPERGGQHDLAESLIMALHDAGTLADVSASFERLPATFVDAVRVGLSQPVSGATPEERLQARAGAIGAALPDEAAVDSLYAWFAALDETSRARIVQELTA